MDYQLIKEYLPILVIVIAIIIFIMYFLVEGFHNFENIPKKYGDLVTDINKSPETGVPKIIHHICPRDIERWHPLWFKCYESWLRIFPKETYKHMIWYDDELNKVIEDSEFSWFLDVFKEYSENIKRIDMVRPFILYKYGGVYADMDIEVYRDFFDQLDQEKVSLAESPYKGWEQVSNCLMASPPKHNFWLVLIDRCYRHKNAIVLKATGPQLFTEVYEENQGLVKLLPDKLFNPAPWFDPNPDIYVKHLNTVMWDGTK